MSDFFLYIQIWITYIDERRLFFYFSFSHFNNGRKHTKHGNIYVQTVSVIFAINAIPSNKHVSQLVFGSEFTSIFKQYSVADIGDGNGFKRSPDPHLIFAGKICLFLRPRIPMYLFERLFSYNTNTKVIQRFRITI